MRTFDLEAAKAGAPVCTRSGLEARIICYDRRGESHCRIIALLDGGEYEHVEFYSIEGELIPNTTTLNDLMMRDDDYTEKLARGEYDNTHTHKIIHKSDIDTENEFEQFDELRGYIQEMACIGQIPADWTGFISCLNSALRKGFDPNRPREDVSTVKENLTVDNPTCKESLPVDREYWGRVYAGQIMPVVFHAVITTGAKVKDEYKDMLADVAVARSAIILADALLAELEKK